MEKRVNGLAEKLLGLGMEWKKSREAITQYLLGKAPLPILCATCSEFHPQSSRNPDACPQCKSTLIVVVKE
ncbi:MAG: hypothetical protein ACYS0I_06040 [Planctomycetota bacterium]|jgi:Zn finger protein HypA/HybF involved in hydrogenase expression